MHYKYLPNNSWSPSFDSHTENCKILWEIVRWSDPIYLPKFNFFPSAAVTIWVSSGCQMSCYACELLHRFLLGKIKGEKREMWVPKRSTHFMGGQMMPSSGETLAKFAYRWREFFPSDSFVFSRPLVCKRSLSILSSKVKDAPIRVYKMPENQWIPGLS